MNPEEVKISQEAIGLAHDREHIRRVISHFAGDQYPSSDNPISVFMAGSPGAGKTEFSKNLIKILEGERGGQCIVRIDPDEIRTMFPGYQGGNAYLFQPAVSILVDKIHDHVISRGKSFVLDGTFSNMGKSIQNIGRSIRRKRAVRIEYLFQDPLVAWNFTKQREIEEGRRIPKTAFVKEFFDARGAVNEVKSRFGSNVQLNIIIRNLNDQNYDFKLNVDSIDNFVEVYYTASELESKLL
jgi:predicted ABC-type ATPase